MLEGKERQWCHEFSEGSKNVFDEDKSGRSSVQTDNLEVNSKI